MTYAMADTIKNKVNEVLILYQQFGHLHYGEGISQLQHMLQSAELAIKENCDDSMVIAAFLHDIGHLLTEKFIDYPKTEYGLIAHDQTGATYLSKLGFSEMVVELVGNHVLAKRYLVATKPGYYATLSEASKKTLELQGGMMTPEEQNNFETSIYFNDYLTLRSFDDKAKQTRISTLKLDAMRSLLTSHLKLNLM